MILGGKQQRGSTANGPFMGGLHLVDREHIERGHRPIIGKCRAKWREVRWLSWPHSSHYRSLRSKVNDECERGIHFPQSFSERTFLK
jgi:hypothetical protein